jgi:hypothetical protein
MNEIYSWFWKNIPYQLSSKCDDVPPQFLVYFPSPSPKPLRYSLPSSMVFGYPCWAKIFYLLFVRWRYSASPGMGRSETADRSFRSKTNIPTPVHFFHVNHGSANCPLSTHSRTTNFLEQVWRSLELYRGIGDILLCSTCLLCWVCVINCSSHAAPL